MNIFVSSPCPIECAKFLDDKRAVKMCLETAQMLSSALIAHGYEGTDVYKMTHKNHPCNVWARETRENFLWLCDHFEALGQEYTARYGRVHKSLSLLPVFRSLSHMIPPGQKTAFANCAANKSLGIDFKKMACVYDAYRLYLSIRWENDKKVPTWYGQE